ncbi:MAG: hypothetical protein ABSG75_11145 [Syntrophales bacterium]|jgi:hypothetical protein
MSLNDEMAADIMNVKYNTDELARTVTYTPLVGNAKQIAAIFHYGSPDGYKGADAFNTEAQMEIQANDAYGVANPQSGETITIGSATWKVMDAVLSESGLEWQCTISRVTR